MQIKFLIVDQNMKELESLAQILERLLSSVVADFSILKSCSPSEACELFRKEKPDCVIVDMRMEHEQGRHLLMNFPDMVDSVGDHHFRPIYFVSSSDPQDLDQERIREIFESCKLDGFLLKPYKEWIVRHTLSRRLAQFIGSFLVDINPFVQNYRRVKKKWAIFGGYDH